MLFVHVHVMLFYRYVLAFLTDVRCLKQAVTSVHKIVPMTSQDSGVLTAASRLKTTPTAGRLDSCTARTVASIGTAGIGAAPCRSASL